jgi:hypothetical protein
MTRNEAAEIIKAVCQGKQRYWRDPHLLKREVERGYTLQDYFNVLKHGRIERDPEYNAEYGNHVVRVRGKSHDGRDTRVAMALARVGPCILISIVDIKQGGKKR